MRFYRDWLRVVKRAELGMCFTGDMVEGAEDWINNGVDLGRGLIVA